MQNQLEIHQCDTIKNEINSLSELLLRVVEDGASIGFLPGITLDEAHEYWKSVLNPDVFLFIARVDHHLAGSIQLHLCTKPNGLHRVEIAKLMTHPDYRRQGVAKHLMKKAEEQAQALNKSLIVLDTREGDPSNLLYTSMNYQQAGKIPGYAQSASGELHATVFYYKELR
ncbi:GNAT family N-acetyltransferase [Jeotgalibacillus sp. R-1-5s-1]|uniref:GNAT family N-acetyltransferase n=1 Tax=Jeotgalibacillus sp. R-1-5s-1 TaxID=2555897 RepID=UPI00106D4A66|nr:GNAT family N-acetyltransferase [Jeotgalibacillus sp. R-1-5s-1]TFD94408.1 GNAT family N-acetyltransferase [Jeotgalibacillus sp. R-1-5s-1]